MQSAAVSHPLAFLGTFYFYNIFYSDDVLTKTRTVNSLEATGVDGGGGGGGGGGGFFLLFLFFLSFSFSLSS